MIVRWLPNDRAPSETHCSDVEQLLFLLRLVPSLYLHGERYRFVRASLVQDDSLFVAIWLQADAAPDDETPLGLAP